MKPKKSLLIILIAFTSIFLSFSQKGSWTIGLSSGIRGEVFQNSNTNLIVKHGTQISTPPMDFTFSYAASNNILLGSGLSFIQAKTNFKTYCFNYLQMFSSEQYPLYSSLQVPISIQLQVPISLNKFNVFTKMGFVFQFPLQQSNVQNITPDVPYFEMESQAGEPTMLGFGYSIQCTSPQHAVNVLFTSTLGLLYKFDNGLGLSLFGDYYLGMREMARVEISYERFMDGISYNTLDGTDTDVGEGVEKLIYRGDYWNVGLGISYTFQKKSQQ